jgi:hypothetical protein
MYYSGTEDIHMKLQLIFEPRYKLGTFRIRNKTKEEVNTVFDERADARRKK